MYVCMYVYVCMYALNIGERFTKTTELQNQETLAYDISINNLEIALMMK